MRLRLAFILATAIFSTNAQASGQDASLPMSEFARDAGAWTVARGLALCGSKNEAEARDCALYVRGIIHGYVFLNSTTIPRRFCSPTPDPRTSTVLRILLKDAVRNGTIIDQIADAPFQAGILNALEKLYPCTK